MSDEPEPETAGESDGMSERAARIILFAVAMLALWGVVAALPELAYVVVGILLTLAWQHVTAWLERRRGQDDEEDQEPEQEAPDVTAALQQLVGDDKGVLLTTLRDHLEAADTKTVKALLYEAGIRWRAGVRTTHGNGPGVHHEDIPPAPPAHDGAHGDGCCCRSDANANTNSTPGEGRGKGLRVEPNGLGGKIVYDLTDDQRHQTVSQ